MIFSYQLLIGPTYRNPNTHLEGSILYDISINDIPMFYQ